MIGSSGRLRWGGRVLWAGAAQAMSSATNFVLYLGLLRFSSPERFGRLVAVLAVYHLVVALARSLVSEPMVAAGAPVGGPSASPERVPAFSWAWARRRYGAIGAGASVGVVVVGWLVGTDRLGVAALALTVPFLVRQDGVRNLAWATGRPQLAVLLDGIWLAVTGSLVGLAAHAGPVGADLVVVTWLAGGLISATVAVALVERLLVAGRPADPNRFAAATSEPTRTPGRADGPPEHRLHGRRRSQALLTVSRNLLPIVVALAFGPAAAGLLKAALVPFTPILSLVAGLRVVVLPAMQRAARPDRTAAELDRFLGRLLVAQLVGPGVAAVATVLAVEAGRERIGGLEAVRGDLLVWGAVVAVMICVATPLADAIGFGRREVAVVPWRLVEIGVEWSAVFLAVVVSGRDGVVVGWAVGVALGALLWLGIGIGGPVPIGTAPASRPAA